MAPGPASSITAACIAAGSFFGAPTLYEMVNPPAAPEAPLATAEKYAVQIAEVSQESLLVVQTGFENVQESVRIAAEQYAPELLEAAQKSVDRIKAEAAVLKNKLREMELPTDETTLISGAVLVLLLLLSIVLIRKLKSGSRADGVADIVSVAADEADEAEPSTPRRKEGSSENSPSTPPKSPRKAVVCEKCGMEMGIFGMRGFGVMEKSHRATCKGAKAKPCDDACEGSD